MSSRSKTAYDGQKHTAKNRGIKFQFEYEDWCQWWVEQLGENLLEKRGCKKGQYVMARNRDQGSYRRGNVKAITIEENTTRYNRRRESVSTKGWMRLPDEVVKSIYLDLNDYSSIAKKYKITKHKIQCIKRKHYYRKITDAVDASANKLSLVDAG